MSVERQLLYISNTQGIDMDSFLDLFDEFPEQRQKVWKWWRQRRKRRKGTKVYSSIFIRFGSQLYYWIFIYDLFLVFLYYFEEKGERSRGEERKEEMRSHHLTFTVIYPYLLSSSPSTHTYSSTHYTHCFPSFFNFFFFHLSFAEKLSHDYSFHANSQRQLINGINTALVY